MLIGCKNISPLERLDNGRIRALDWDMVLDVPNFPPEAAFIGIRMHDVRPGRGKNSFRCKVVREIENPFSYTVMLKPAKSGCAAPIGWETDKETWTQLRSGEIDICLPPEALLLLKD